MSAKHRIGKRRFLGYLHKLAVGEGVDEAAFKRGMAELGLDEQALLGGARREFVRGRQARFHDYHQTTLDDWVAWLEEAHASERIEGARLGNSHRARVSGAVLLMRRHDQRHPQVILVEDDTPHFPVPPAPRALLVENLENFLALDATLALLPECGLGTEWQQADVLYGSGNSVTNHMLTPALQRYQAIGCLFDPDPGGIRMCDTLFRRGSLPPLQFVAPSNLEERLQRAAAPRLVSPAQRRELSRYISRTPPVAKVAELIRRSGRSLEQETYLAGLPPHSGELS
ncbi:hypothetical protein [Halomonas garicola]|uniref:hypothetical protein n=1 Tax=Halomonas garicola TaxID=1690008 RepID=UPI0028A0C7D2|nr:hypothetical protein [Halomonas garicola]